jgi:integrase
MKAKVRLAKSAVAAIAPGRVPVLYHTDLAWLKLLVLPSGVKSWVFMRRHDGRLVKKTLGRIEEMTPDEAREKVLVMVSPGGLDKLPDRMAFAELWARWKSARMPYWRRNTANAVDQGGARMLAELGRLRLCDIDAEFVGRLHRSIGERSGRVSANRSMELANTCWLWGARHAGINGKNPFAGIEHFREERRRRILHGEEMRRFMTALESLEGRAAWARDWIRLALLTGARMSNLLWMRWDEIDMEKCVWTIPEEKFKGGRRHLVPLLPEAMEILKRRQAEKAGDRQHVFRYRSQNNLRAHFYDVCGQAGITDLTVHDLRRTVGSHLAAAGVPMPTIAEILGHTDIATTQIYAVIAGDMARKGLESIRGIMDQGK